jgi:thiol-disulfide isomerase/thioredoxin
MRPTTSASAFVLLIAVCLGGGAGLAAVEVGDAAPPLGRVAWIKGDAVKLGGALTVVEFWATWCAPCRQSIPHLTELQKRYGDQLRVIGLSGEDEAAVRPFVASMGPRMDYRVGLADEDLSKAYMGSRQGIPYAFLIGGDSKVLWIGHPMSLKRILASIAAHTFDIAAQVKVSALHEQLNQVISGGPTRYKPAIGIIDQILALDPVDLEAVQMRINIGNYLKDPALVRETLARIPTAALDAETADQLVEERLAEDTLVERSLDLALAFSDRALQAAPADPAVFATRAHLFATLGLIDEALALALKGVALAPGDTGLVGDVAYFRDLKALRERLAAGGGAAAPAPATPTAAVPVP